MVHARLFVKAGVVLIAVFAAHTTLHIAPSIVALLGAGVLILICGFGRSGYMASVEWDTLLYVGDCSSWWARWSRRTSSAIWRARPGTQRGGNALSPLAMSHSRFVVRLEGQRHRSAVPVEPLVGAT